MLKFKLAKEKSQPLKIMCLGAHSDDIEIGCGGTILTLLKEYKDTEVFWVVFSANEIRKHEATNSAKKFTSQANKVKIIVKNFQDGFFPYTGGEIKEYFEELKPKFSPDLIFTHYGNDLHQDHRNISELTWNTYRDNIILEYEVLKYDGDLGNPNIYYNLNRKIVRQKLQYIKKFYLSQRDNHWFNDPVFKSIMRLRGVESNSKSTYAEAFYSRKFVIE